MSQVSLPINWMHTNRDGPDHLLHLDLVKNVPEEGKCIHGGLKGLYGAHLKGSDYKYYNRDLDCKKGWPFLNHVTPAQKKKWSIEIKQEEAEKPEDGKKDWCYLIYHGPGMGLYRSHRAMEANRDQDYHRGAREEEPHGNLRGYSAKAREFKTVEDAKMFCQAIRDVEGAFWDWKAEMPIYWGKDWQNINIFMLCWIIVMLINDHNVSPM